MNTQATAKEIVSFIIGSAPQKTIQYLTNYAQAELDCGSSKDAVYEMISDYVTYHSEIDLSSDV